MSNQKTYKQLLRDLIREQGDPDAFDPSLLQMDDAQLAIALTEYDHILGEAALEASPHLLDLMSGRRKPVAGLRVPEEIGILWRAYARERAEPLVRRDAELLADDMACEARIDNEYEVSHA